MSAPDMTSPRDQKRAERLGWLGAKNIARRIERELAELVEAHNAERRAGDAEPPTS